MVAFLDIDAGGRNQADTAHIAFEYFFGVLGSALEVGGLRLSYGFLATHNPDQCRYRQFAFGHFPAADYLCLGRLEDSLHDQAAQLCLDDFGRQQLL